jgi:diguanylate cyclase
MNRPIESHLENRTNAQSRVGDVINRIGKDLNTDQAVGILTTMLLLAEFKGKTDPLTGTYNRRAFDEVIERLTKDNSTQFALVIFDIDDFKKVNDGYGHATGDKVLVEVAHELKEALRNKDFLARIGGEEFCAVIPLDLFNDLELFCRKCNTSIEEMGRVLSDAQPVGPITISQGAGIYDHSKPFKDFFNEVDAKLYEAKQSGKNTYRILTPNV